MVDALLPSLEHVAEAADKDLALSELRRQLADDGWRHVPVLSCDPCWHAYRTDTLDLLHTLPVEKRELAERHLFGVLRGFISHDAERRAFGCFHGLEGTSYYAGRDGFIGASNSAYEISGGIVGVVLSEWRREDWERALDSGRVRVFVHVGRMNVPVPGTWGTQRTDMCVTNILRVHRTFTVAISVRACAADVVETLQDPYARVSLLTEASELPFAIIASGLDVDGNLPPNDCGDRETCLEAACYNGNVRGLRALLGAGADPSRERPRGQRRAGPLIQAAAYGHSACVMLLLDSLSARLADVPDAADAFIACQQGPWMGCSDDEAAVCGRIAAMHHLRAAGAPAGLDSLAICSCLGTVNDDARMLGHALLLGAPPDQELELGPCAGVQMRPRPRVPLEFLLCGAPQVNESENGETRQRHALPMIVFLAAYGASRTLPDGTRAEQYVRPDGLGGMARAFLQRTRAYSTPLHYVAHLPTSHVVHLLATGADVHAPGGDGGPTPYELAAAAIAQDEPTTSQLLVVHGRGSPLEPAVRHLMPLALRPRFLFLQWVGAQLARAHAVDLAPAWEAHVVPRCLAASLLEALAMAPRGLEAVMPVPTAERALAEPGAGEGVLGVMRLPSLRELALPWVHTRRSTPVWATLAVHGARGWSPGTHWAFPRPERQRARYLAWLGARLGAAHAHAPSEFVGVWHECVMPLLMPARLLDCYPVTPPRRGRDELLVDLASGDDARARGLGGGCSLHERAAPWLELPLAERPSWVNIVCLGGATWSVDTHALFGPAIRHQARFLSWVGAQLTRRFGLGGGTGAHHVWETCVLPCVLREDLLAALQLRSEERAACAFTTSTTTDKFTTWTGGTALEPMLDDEYLDWAGKLVVDWDDEVY